jgi:hypothetical protein
MVHAFCGSCGKECWSPYLCCGHADLPISNFCHCNGNPIEFHEKHFGKEWRKDKELWNKFKGEVKK